MRERLNRNLRNMSQDTKGDVHEFPRRMVTQPRRSPRKRHQGRPRESHSNLLEKIEANARSQKGRKRRRKTRQDPRRKSRRKKTKSPREQGRREYRIDSCAWSC